MSVMIICLVSVGRTANLDLRIFAFGVESTLREYSPYDFLLDRLQLCQELYMNVQKIHECKTNLHQSNGDDVDR